MRVPVPGTVWHAWLLTQELDSAGQARQLDELAYVLSWCRFRADWVARTGLWPLSDVRDTPWDRDDLPLPRTRDRVEDVPAAVAFQRKAERVLRCCRTAVWYWSTDPLRWSVAAMLLRQGWLGGELDLVAAVDGIAAGQ